MEIRRFQPEDAAETAQMIAETLLISNSKDYSREYIERIIASHSAEIISERAKDGHMYVACDGSRIIGCGAIAGYWGSIVTTVEKQ